MKQAIVRILAVALVAVGTVAANQRTPDTTVDPSIPIPICPTCGAPGHPTPPQAPPLVPSSPTGVL